MSQVIVRIPRKQVQAEHTRLVEYTSGVFRLHLGIANNMAHDIIKFNDREAASDMYGQAMKLCHKLAEEFGFKIL